MALFNRELLRKNLNRCATNFSKADFLHKETAQIIIQSAQDFPENFDNILEIGAKDGFLGKKLKSKRLIQGEFSEKFVKNYGLNLVIDDENLRFENKSFNLILSNLNLHLINDLPHFLQQSKNILKSKGRFIASFFGEENLKEMRKVFLTTEDEIHGKVSARIAPNIDIKSAGMLLQKAGFSDVVCQKHSFEVSYSNLKNLFLDLRNMGQSNILNAKSRQFMSKNFFKKLEENYQKLYSNSDGELICTFEIVIISCSN